MTPIYGIGMKKMKMRLLLSIFRKLTYDKKLTLGARLFGLACLDHPGEGNIKIAVVARRMHCTSHQARVWKRQLEKRYWRFSEATSDKIALT